MAALTSATLQPFPDPGLGRDAKSMCVFFWTKEESWKNRGTFGHPRPLSHLEELLGIVLPGWQAHDKLLAVLLHHQRAGEHLSVCLHSWLVQLGFSLRLCWGKELHGFFKTNPAVGIHAVCAKGWELILKWIWEGQCYYPFSEGLSKALQRCPPVEKKSKRGCKGTGRVSLLPSLASGARQVEECGMSVRSSPLCLVFGDGSGCDLIPPKIHISSPNSVSVEVGLKWLQLLQPPERSSTHLGHQHGFYLFGDVYKISPPQPIYCALLLEESSSCTTQRSTEFSRSHFPSGFDPTWGSNAFSGLLVLDVSP